MNIISFAKKSLAVAIGIIIIVIIFLNVRVISEGERAVKLRFGQDTGQVLSPGLNFVLFSPFVESLQVFNIREQKLEVKADSASSDLQSVSSVIAVNYQIDASKVAKLYSEIGKDYELIVISPAIQESIKSATAKFTASELITKRSAVKEEMNKTLKDRLQNRYITLLDVSIVDFKFSKEFDSAIEAKQVAEQQALRAEQDLKRIEIEAKQTIERAKAEAESLRLQKENLSGDLIELRKIEAQKEAIQKWDGVLPKYTGDSTPLINLDIDK